jgi:hypothetical protein
VSVPVFSASVKVEEGRGRGKGRLRERNESPRAFALEEDRLDDDRNLLSYIMLWHRCSLSRSSAPHSFAISFAISLLAD